MLFVPFFLQALLSADRAGMTGRMVLGDSRKVVYFALFCQGYSAFGLVRAQKHARRFYIATILLRIVCWVPILLSFSANALCLTPTGLLYTTEWQWTGSKETEMEIIGRTMSNYSREALEVGSDRSVFCGLIVPGSSNYHYQLSSDAFRRPEDNPSLGEVPYREATLETFAQLPQMLQRSCVHGDFDAFMFHECMEVQGWLANLCNADAIACQMPQIGRGFLDFVTCLYITLPAFMLSGWLLLCTLSTVWFRECLLTEIHEDRELRKAVRRKAKQLQQEMMQQEATFKERAKSYFALLMFCFDLASDAVCFGQFIMTQQFGFAAAQGIIMLFAAASELWKGGPTDLLHAFRDFRKTGVPSDKYLSILHAEQTLEAPLSFLLQYYSAFFTSGSEDVTAFFTLCFSIMMSLYAISKAVYDNIHLGMEEVFDEAEELADSEPPTPSAERAQLPPPPALVSHVVANPSEGLALTAPLPPPPGLSPGMAAAIAQPPKVVVPVQLGHRLKETE
ncbi:Uncharacterized protein SCF082_LOCUS46947 [Durusdinium trenchii]